MLLVHQAGSVKIGEVVRYTLTYTPSADRILPTPSHLHVKIKNTSAIALRAAYIHGPYTVHVAAYPSTFNPNRKVEHPRHDGVPEFEPYLKAGGSWTARLTVPEEIRESGGKPNLKRTADGEHKRVTWIVEIASQIIFSHSASVHYELLVGRDERSLELGFAAAAGHGHGEPGQVQDHQQGRNRREGHHAAQPKGVYSKAVKLVVDDTTSLWNKPALPERAHKQAQRGHRDAGDGRPRLSGEKGGARKQKRIHLVILTHGLHSNLGADMLYVKESIDATAKEARESKRAKRRAAGKGEQPKSAAQEADGVVPSRDDGAQGKDTATAPLSGGQESLEDDSEDDDDEQVVVRGFNGNAVRTERGIAYLGKRMANFVLETTYPDQPFLPVKKTLAKKLSNGLLSSSNKNQEDGIPALPSSNKHSEESPGEERAYRYTSISFIGHSLGGLVQMYAIAYIQKHSPDFFEKIKPVNFVTMASPLLGLSNENPLYVKFALDFGLVGRTGQDLGLTWRPPTLARSGWNALIGGLGVSNQKEQQHADPGAKPLLRILPNGPAHRVLRMFRNRTVYSNVVNDGIVPLRTSCLLFLDWRGLGKVEKARRENGLIGTMAGWGWAELTGQNSSTSRHAVEADSPDDSGADEPGDHGTIVPQPSDNATKEDNESVAALDHRHSHAGIERESDPDDSSTKHGTSALDTFLNFLRPSTKPTKNDKRMVRSGQTVKMEGDKNSSGSDQQVDNTHKPQDEGRSRRPATRGDSIMEDPSNVLAPPKTTFFESAGDLLKPPIPPTSWIVDPSSRSRTIFHDRVYHPEDIPPPPLKRPTRLARSFSSERSLTNSEASSLQGQTVDSGGMRVEEKIARAYHRDLSWRKVLVRLEPDAHNNIIVRRMFANAYGWPVVKHLCDTHFADTHAANTRDEHEPAIDRAQGTEDAAREHGEEVQGQADRQEPERSKSEMREAADELAPLKPATANQSAAGPTRRHYYREDSALWDDSYLEGSEDDDDEGEEDDGWNPIQRFLSPLPRKRRHLDHHPQRSAAQAQTQGTSQAEIAGFLTAEPPAMEGHPHRGLAATSSSSSSSHDQVAQHEADSDPAETIADDRLTESPRSTTSSQHAGGTAELGLRKSLGEQLGASPVASSSGVGRQRSGSHGVSEQVARFTSLGSPKEERAQHH